MERHVPRPKDLTTDPNSAEASKTFKDWYQTIQDYLATLQELRRETDPQINKARIVRSCLSPEIFSYIEDAQDYDSIIATLRQLYVKPKNNIYAQHLLVSRKQGPHESVCEYLQALRMLAKDCVFQQVTAVIYCDELIRDSFINGLKSAAIHQRLLESNDITLQRASKFADSLERAHMQAASMGMSTNILSSIHNKETRVESAERDYDKNEDVCCSSETDKALFAVTSKTLQCQQKSKKCFYCGGPMHNRSHCPAREQTCHKCGKRGHFMKVCRSTSSKRTSYSSSVYKENEDNYFASFTCAGAPDCLQRTVVNALINDQPVKALLDTGASENFINKAVADNLQLNYERQSTNALMASTELNLTTHGRVNTSL